MTTVEHEERAPLAPAGSVEQKRKTRASRRTHGTGSGDLSGKSGTGTLPNDLPVGSHRSAGSGHLPGSGPSTVPGRELLAFARVRWCGHDWMVLPLNDGLRWLGRRDGSLMPLIPEELFELLD